MYEEKIRFFLEEKKQVCVWSWFIALTGSIKRVFLNAHHIGTLHLCTWTSWSRTLCCFSLLPQPKARLCRQQQHNNSNSVLSILVAERLFWINNISFIHLTMYLVHVWLLFYNVMYLIFLNRHHFITFCKRKCNCLLYGFFFENDYNIYKRSLFNGVSWWNVVMDTIPSVIGQMFCSLISQNRFYPALIGSGLKALLSLALAHNQNIA